MFKQLSAIIFLAFTPKVAFAECSPVEFFTQDVENITLSDDIKTAFLQTASREQYNKATQGGKTSFGYGPYQGNLDYDQAKEGSVKESTLKGFTYDREYYLRYISQKLSKTATDAYAKCLEQDRSSPGLRIWLDRTEGPFYFLKAFWVGRDTTQGLGAVAGEPILKGFEKIQIPTEWPKGATQEILLQKLNDDAVISLRVSNESAAFVSVREPPVILMANSKVESQIVEIGSGGSSDGKHPIVQPQHKEQCVYPSVPGRVLLLGSGHVYELVQNAVPGTTSAVQTVNSPDRMCFAFDSRTGDKNVRNTISGKVAAFERYVVK